MDDDFDEMPDEMQPVPPQLSASLRAFLNALSGQGEGHLFMPDMDVAYLAGAVLVRVDIPGLSSEDVDVSMYGHMLVIQGERVDDLEGVARIHHERPHSRFRRFVPMPPSANVDEISSNISRGVLTVTVPLSAPVEGQQIHVHDDEPPQER